MAERLPDGRFAPGVCPNPGGRTKAAKEIARLAAEHGPEAIAQLARILVSSEDEGARIKAAEVLLERGFGKPMQAVELSGPDGGPLNVRGLIDAPPPETREQWEERVRKQHGL